jgi:RNA polymerase sigma-70 factor, ECF subfamily
MHRAEDRDRVSRPVRGAPFCFEELHAHFFDFVWASLRALGVPFAGLDDAAQEVFVALYRRLPDFEGRSTLKTFVFGIVVGVARNSRRAERRANRLRPLDQVDDIADACASPLDRVVVTQALRMVARILDQMDDSKREVLVLAEWEQMSAPEIARVLGIGVNTVYSRLRLGRAEFERLLARGRRRSP